MHRPIQVACVVGARPNFMKISPILAEMNAGVTFRPWLIHTGQHSSPEMSGSFFEELNIPRPDVSLGVSGGSSNQQTARVMIELEPLFLERRPDLVLVVGDVNATVAAAMTAAKVGISVAHVEAGLRSFDRSMPEEINRIVTDSLSDYLFTTEPGARDNLRREGVPDERIYFCGNVMIDTLTRFRPSAQRSSILQELHLETGRYVLVTLHRPANVDDPEKLIRLVEMLECLAEHIPVVFPMHPRTRNVIETSGVRVRRVQLAPPQGYIDFLRLTSDARLVLTDSGGIQEETTILGVTCLTVRDNTERPVTIAEGTNRLVGTDPDMVLAAALEALEAPPASPKRPALWDGNAAKRIVCHLQELLSPTTAPVLSSAATSL